MTAARTLVGVLVGVHVQGVDEVKSRLCRDRGFFSNGFLSVSKYIYFIIKDNIILLFPQLDQAHSEWI